MLLDTCFLIDLSREFANAKHGNAKSFLEKHHAVQFQISVITVLEFLEGFNDPKLGEELLRAFLWLDVDPSISRIAAAVRRSLRRQGALIGDFDILIAATALAHDLPLVTGNLNHFLRVEGLRLVKYKT